MNNEFVPFVHSLEYKEIEHFLYQCGMEYRLSFHPSSYKMYKGVSDGRFAINDTLCFVDRIPKEHSVKNLNGALVITTKKLHAYFPEANAVYTTDPRALFIHLLERFDKERICSPFTSEIPLHAQTIDSNAIIDANATVEEGVSIGAGSIISAGCVLKRGTVIGENCILRENCIIGCDGISLYKSSLGENLRFPHLAGVRIGNNVELGANSVIVRGTLTNTVIGDDTVIGNLCNIGHGVKIGEKVWMSVGTLIGGNCTLGNRTTIGLGARVKDNLKIGENVSIGMGSVVTKNLPSDISVFGNPAKKLRSLTTGPQR